MEGVNDKGSTGTKKKKKGNNYSNMKRRRRIKSHHDQPKRLSKKQLKQKGRNKEKRVIDTLNRIILLQQPKPAVIYIFMWNVFLL